MMMKTKKNKKDEKLWLFGRENIRKLKTPAFVVHKKYLNSNRNEIRSSEALEPNVSGVQVNVHR